MSNAILSRSTTRINNFHHTTARSIANQVSGLRRPRPHSRLTNLLLAAQFRDGAVGEVARQILQRAHGLRDARRIHWVELASDALLLPRPERDRFFAALKVLVAETGGGR